MTKRKLLKEFEPGHGFSKEDWDEVSDNPEWAAEDFARARPFREVFPELAASIEREGVVVVGDPKVNQTIVVERRIVDKFKETGGDWQKRINDVLRKAAGL